MKSKVTSRRLVFVGAPLLLAGVANAQPSPAADPVQPAPPPVTVEPVLDETKINEMVDRRVTKILEERAARQAAEEAAKGEATKTDKPEPAKPSDESGGNGFVDVRLNFTCGHENVLVQPGETVPSIPGLRCSVPTSSALMFFDNYDTRFSGFENLNHQIMYRRVQRGHIDAEGALLLRQLMTQDQVIFDDGGSYVSVAYWQDKNQKAGNRVRFTAFPNNSDRMRLGYSYRLSWGGNEDIQRGRTRPPGFKLQWDNDKAYAFVGVKTATYKNPEDGEQHVVGAALAGGGVDLSDILRVEVNGGYFRRGNNELLDVSDQPVDLFGASAQISLHKGMPVQSSIDYKLYKFDAHNPILMFSPYKYTEGLSWLVMAEGTVLGQTLKDAEKAGSTKVQMATAGDLNVRVAKGRTRFRVDAQFRSLEYVLHSVPSLPTFSTFPEDYTPGANYFFAAGVDQNWKDALTVGVQAGLERPATLTTPAAIPGTQTAEVGETTVVIRSIDRIQVLPVGEAAVPLFAVKATAQLTFNKYFSVIGNAFYTMDGNQTRFARESQEDELRYVFDNFHQLGFHLTLQARM